MKVVIFRVLEDDLTLYGREPHICSDWPDKEQDPIFFSPSIQRSRSIKPAPRRVCKLTGSTVHLKKRGLFKMSAHFLPLLQQIRHILANTNGNMESVRSKISLSLLLCIGCTAQQPINTTDYGTSKGQPNIFIEQSVVFGEFVSQFLGSKASKSKTSVRHLGGQLRFDRCSFYDRCKRHFKYSS